MFTKNCANKQGNMIMNFFDLKINLFLEWSIYKLVAGIKDGRLYDGFNRWGKIYFLFF